MSSTLNTQHKAERVAPRCLGGCSWLFGDYSPQ